MVTDCCYVRKAGKAVSICYSNSSEQVFTWDDVARIHGVLVLDEAEAIHEFDLGDLASSVSLEMGLDVCFGSIAGEVPQIEARSRYLCHGGGSGGWSVSGNLAWPVEVSAGRQRDM